MDFIFITAITLSAVFIFGSGISLIFITNSIFTFKLWNVAWVTMYYYFFIKQIDICFTCTCMYFLCYWDFVLCLWCRGIIVNCFSICIVMQIIDRLWDECTCTEIYMFGTWLLYFWYWILIFYTYHDFILIIYKTLMIWIVLLLNLVL